MKRILTLALAALAFAAVSCQKQAAELPKAEFETNLYQVPTMGSVDVVVKLDKAATAALEIPVTLGGSAAKGTEYSVSAEKVSIAAGASSGSVKVTDLGLSSDKTITLTLGTGNGYSLGTKYLATVTPEPLEALVYSFKVAKADLVESVSLTITLTGENSGASFKATSDLDIPVKLEGDGSAYVVMPDKITVAKGQNSGSITLTPNPDKQAALEALEADPRVKVVVDRSAASRTLLPGDVEAVNVRVHCGLQVPARLVGTWNFKKIYALEEVEFFYEEMEDDLDLLPTHNDGFTLTFAENDETGDVTLTPGGTGDFLNYFRPATITLTNPINYTAEGEPVGNYTVSELNMFIGFDEEDGYMEPAIFTYYKLSAANRSFDNTAESIGESVIAFRLNDKGQLEMMLRDYDEPPFGFMWWDENFDPDLFGFASLFTKAE